MTNIETRVEAKATHEKDIDLVCFDDATVDLDCVVCRIHEDLNN